MEDCLRRSYRKSQTVLVLQEFDKLTEMNSAVHVARRLTTGASVARNLRLGLIVLDRPLTALTTRNLLTRAEKLNRFAPALGTRQMTTCAKKFEVVNIQDEEDFKKRVIDSSFSVPVIVDFHATWCGPCRLLGPRLESIIAEEKGKVVMAKVDIDDNSELAMKYGVQSVPTVIGVKNGQIQSQFIGLIDDDQIRSFIARFLIS